MNEKGMLFCKRKGKIIKTNTKGIASENYFYELRHLTVSDLYFIEKIFCNENNQTIFNIGKEYLNVFSFVNSIINIKEKIGNQKIKYNIDILTKEFNENIHTSIEKNGQKYLEMLYNENISFYNTNKGNCEFNIFICEQYFRTKRMKESIMQTNIPIKNVNFENCWTVGAHILSTNLAGTLSIKKESYKCILLKNNTEIPFLTSDQPVINIPADKNHIRKLEQNNFELYYPITPKLALIIGLKINFLGNDEILELDILNVKKYNSIMISQSGDFIFSNSLGSII
jgi:hypothetical protein